MLALAARMLLTIGSVMVVGSLYACSIATPASGEQVISQVSLTIGVIALAVAVAVLGLNASFPGPSIDVDPTAPLVESEINHQPFKE